MHSCMVDESETMGTNNMIFWDCLSYLKTCWTIVLSIIIIIIIIILIIIIIIIIITIIVNKIILY